MNENNILTKVRNELFRELEIKLLEKKFVDLNCQLLEMGSADFWVEKIMENYLNCDFEDSSDVVYPLNDLIRATGSMEQVTNERGRLYLQANLLRRIYGSSSTVRRDNPNSSSESVTNKDLLSLLREEDQRLSAIGDTSRSRPLRELIRGWFEPLGHKTGRRTQLRNPFIFAI